MTNDMTRGAITPLLIRFTIPLVLGNLFQLFAGNIGGFGHAGQEAEKPQARQNDLL